MTSPPSPLSTAYRESAPPAQCARCGTQHAAAGHALCAGCARRERTRDVRVLVLVGLGLGTAVGAVAIARLEPRAFPRAGPAAAGGGSDELVSTAEGAAGDEPNVAREPAPGASVGAVQAALAVVDPREGDTNHEQSAVLVRRARPCPSEPGGACHELALLEPDGVARWQAPLAPRTRVGAVDGVVVTAELLHLTARSAATGGVLWEREHRLAGEPLAVGGAEHTALVTDGAHASAFATDDGTPRFELALGPARAAPPPHTSADGPRARVRLALGAAGVLVADFYAPDRAVIQRTRGAVARADLASATEWIGGGARLCEAVDHETAGARAARVTALRAGFRAGAFDLDIARADDRAVIAGLGTGPWEPVAVDAEADPGALIAFRGDGAGGVYALAEQRTELVLVALRGTPLTVQWSRRVALDPAAGMTQGGGGGGEVVALPGPREPAPVGLAASPRAVVLALDAGRRLAWFDPRSGALLRAVPDVVVR